MNAAQDSSPALGDAVVIGPPQAVTEARLITPEYDRTLYRPDTAIDGWTDGRIVVRAASVRGYQHRHDGSPRQDDFALLGAEDGRAVFVAVADGLSSARNSHVGSSYATRYAVRWLDETVKAKHSATASAEIDWPGLLSDCVRSASFYLLQETARLFGVEQSVSDAARLTATTLVCAAVVTDASESVDAWCVSVGDSGVWHLADGEFSPSLGGKATDTGGIADSSVRQFLPGGIPEEFDVQHLQLAPATVLLLGTDGFGDPLGSGRGAVGDLFRAALENRVPSRTEFAHLLDFQRETFDDDRTLVCVWPQTEETAHPTPVRDLPRQRGRGSASAAPGEPSAHGSTPLAAAPTDVDDSEQENSQPTARESGAGEAPAPTDDMLTDPDAEPERPSAPATDVPGLRAPSHSDDTSRAQAADVPAKRGKQVFGVSRAEAVAASTAVLAVGFALGFALNYLLGDGDDAPQIPVGAAEIAAPSPLTGSPVTSAPASPDDAAPEETASEQTEADASSTTLPSGDSAQDEQGGTPTTLGAASPSETTAPGTTAPASTTTSTAPETTQLLPPPPSEVQLTGRQREITISWTAPESDDAPITRYGVQYRRASDPNWQPWPHSDASTRATIDGLDDSTVYEVQIQTLSSAGWGNWSASVMAETLARSFETTPPSTTPADAADDTDETPETRDGAESDRSDSDGGAADEDSAGTPEGSEDATGENSDGAE